MRSLAPISLLTVGLLLGGCSPADAPGSTGGAQEASAPAEGPSAPELGATLDVEEFAAAMERPGTVLLDVRTPGEFDAGHLEGAVNIDATAPDFRERLAELDPDVPYAVYCQSGNRSGTALSVMEAEGFTDAYHLGGGIGAWRQAGQPVVGH